MIAYKVLGQVSPGAGALTPLYTTPGGKSSIVSTLTVCNRSATPTKFRVAVQPGGAAISDKHNIYYDVDIAGNDTFAATLGWTLAATDLVSCYATAATLSFSLFGAEQT